MAIQVTSRPSPQTGDFSVSKASKDRVAVIMARYPEDRKASGIIPLLDIAQRENGGWLSKEAIEWVAEQTESAPIRVYEIASYTPGSARSLGLLLPVRWLPWTASRRHFAIGQCQAARMT